MPTGLARLSGHKLYRFLDGQCNIKEVTIVIYSVFKTYYIEARGL